MRFAIYTLGCKVNQYESQALEQAGLARGHTLVPFGEEAQIYIVNTCTVTNLADQKNRQVIRRCRREHPAARLCVCGCFPQTHAGQAEALGADLVCGTGDRGLFWARVEEAAGQKAPATFVDDALRRRDFEELPAGGLAQRTRCMLKVEDGCVNFCSYCIIPYARGPVRSLPLERAVAQAREMAAQGYREMVLTGIEISSWGRDLPGRPTLADLLEALSAAIPTMRLRLGSLEPRTVTEGFCRRMSSLHNVCPHFHLSLQSGCDKTLRAMGRKYSAARFLESVELLRKYYVNPGLTADLIVGFPGESEEVRLFRPPRVPLLPAARHSGGVSAGPGAPQREKAPGGPGRRPGRAASGPVSPGSGGPGVGGPL